MSNQRTAIQKAIANICAARRGKHEKERKPANAHDKRCSEVDLTNAFQKGWDDAMLRRSIGPHGTKEGT